MTIYISHCLEHIKEKAAKVIFKEAYRILKPEGIFRVVVPNIDLLLDAYLRKDYEFLERFSEKDDEYHQKVIRYFSYYKADNVSKEKFDELIKNKFREQVYDYFKSDDFDPKTHLYNRHINWFNFNKIVSFALMAKFKKENIILSGYKQSISSEMRAKEFDNTHPELSVFVDIVR